jgi:hypothetical protein
MCVAAGTIPGGGRTGVQNAIQAVARRLGRAGQEEKESKGQTQCLKGSELTEANVHSGNNQPQNVSYVQADYKETESRRGGLKESKERSRQRPTDEQATRTANMLPGKPRWFHDGKSKTHRVQSG